MDAWTPALHYSLPEVISCLIELSLIPDMQKDP